MVEETNNYTVDQAARLLEVSPACVRQMLRAGELEGERREESIEGVLGPWRIPGRVVHSVREVREKADALREELEILEGRLEVVEIAESALRKDLQREKERADRERERADELQAELDAERARRREDSQESGQWLFKG